VPDSPLEEARRERIELQGRSPFIEITVPEAVIRLKQRLGRLISRFARRGRRHGDVPGSPPRHQTLARSADAGLA
jgi:hypothetical protein